MADTSRTLTQWEIDNLLNQIPETAAVPGEVEDAPIAARDRGLARTIKTYDFRRPDKFSKEQWQTLTTMHETFARMIGAQFSSRMRTLVSVRLSSIDQGLYEEWQLQIPSETACYVFSLAPLSGSIVVEFNHDVAAEVIDRLLGGTAVIPVRDHDLSDIEMVLLRSFGRALGAALGEMWVNVNPVEPEVQEFGLDASLSQVAGPNDVVVTAFFEVNLGNRLGAMSICCGARADPAERRAGAGYPHASRLGLCDHGEPDGADRRQPGDAPGPADRPPGDGAAAPVPRNVRASGCGSIRRCRQSG